MPNLVSGCLVSIIAFATVAFAQPRPATFFEPRQFAAGTEPIAAVIADFNRDGKPDVAVADEAGGTVCILLNNGDGFASPVTYAAGSHPKSIATADFNHDGKADLAVAGGTGFVYILLGNGDGTFQSAIAIPLPSPAYAVVAGDFTGHGQADLALAAGDILVLPGHGDGTFGAPKITKTGYGAVQLAAGDLNHDGKLDLVVRTTLTGYEPPSQLVSLLGKGDGTFEPYKIIDPGYYAPVPYLHDLNGDGFADLIEPGVTVQLGNGDGTFQPGVSYLVDGGDAPTFADINGDGHVDILTTGTASVSILPGNGDGTFQRSYSYAANIDPVWIGTADFLGHGAHDILVLNKHGGLPGYLSLLPGLPGGTYRAQRTVDFDQALGNKVLADFNGDGKLDAAVLGVDSVQILLGDGSGGFTKLAPLASGPYPIGLATADFNGDGIPDLAVTYANYNFVSIFLGKGDGTFAKAGSYTVPPNCAVIASADLNGDGAADLVVLGTYGVSIAQVLLGDGHGGFGAPLTIASTTYFLSNDVIGDFNGDGIPDIAFAEYQGGGPGVELFLGNGDGTFQDPLFPYPHGALNIAAGDFNGDGNLDLALLGAVDGGEMLILLGNGNGTFQTGQATPNAPTASFNFIAADLNGDGYPDLLTDNGGSVFSVYLGNGDGTFTEQGPKLPCVGGGCAAAAGDLTGDGKLDIVFNQASGAPINPLSVLINTTANR